MRWKQVAEGVVGAEGQGDAAEGEEGGEEAEAARATGKANQGQEQAEHADVGDPFGEGVAAEGLTEVAGVVRQQGEAQSPGRQAEGGVIAKGQAAAASGEAGEFEGGQGLDGAEYEGEGENQGQQPGWRARCSARGCAVCALPPFCVLCQLSHPTVPTTQTAKMTA